MLKPIIQQATPQGTKMSDSENEESPKQIFTKMKELDSKNDKDKQILTAENLARIGQYLDRISNNSWRPCLELLPSVTYLCLKPKWCVLELIRIEQKVITLFSTFDTSIKFHCLVSFSNVSIWMF